MKALFDKLEVAGEAQDLAATFKTEMMGTPNPLALQLDAAHVNRHVIANAACTNYVGAATLVLTPDQINALHRILDCGVANYRALCSKPPKSAQLLKMLKSKSGIL